MPTTAKQIDFRRPFQIGAVAGWQPAGTYTVRITHDFATPSVVMGWQPTEIILELVRDGRVMDVRIDAQELCEALVHDGDQGTDPPANPGISKPKPRVQRSRPF